jgi:arsenate reductase
MIRAKEPVFEKLKLNEPGKSRKDLLRAVCENPVLLQRPIVIRPDGRGIIARPPEKVLELL